MNFRIVGLPAADFSAFFSMSDAELEQRLAMRRVASDSGFPCRISLTDAAPGEEVLLVNYAHHAVATPFRSIFAIYVRPGEETYDRVNEVPQQLRKRLLSLRAYDWNGMLLNADVVEGAAVEPVIERLFADDAVAYLHAHFAKPGCYAAKILRA